MAVSDIPNASIIILSCDKFSDTWELVCHSFEKYWPDCPYQKYLLTNYKKPKVSGIEVIDVGKDISWSSNLIKTLDKIRTDYVFLWLDDVFLSSTVDTDVVHADFVHMMNNNLDYLSLRSSGMHLLSTKEYEVIPTNSSYRTSIFATFWKVKTLTELLDSRENAWQFEIKGSTRSNKYVAFQRVKRTRFKYIHAIEKGLWWPSGVKYARRESIHIDLTNRALMPRTLLLKYRLLLPKKIILAVLPPLTKSLVLKYAKIFYLKTGLRSESYYD